MPPIMTVAFWSLLAERCGRQAAQVAAPLLLALYSAGQLTDGHALLGVAVAVAVTVGKGLLQALGKWSVPDGAPLLWQLADRAVPAAAGALLGMLPAGTDVAGVQWGGAFGAAAGAGLVAVLGYWVTPPGKVAEFVDGAWVITRHGRHAA